MEEVALNPKHTKWNVFLKGGGNEVRETKPMTFAQVMKHFKDCVGVMALK